MPSKAHQLNSQMRRRVIQKAAEHVHRTWKHKLVEMRIPSNVPKDLNYADSIQIRWLDYYTAQVGSTVPYSVNIEYGRQAGVHAPIEPIVQWVMSKKHPGISRAKAVQIAYAIEDKLFREGVRGRHVLRLVLEDVQAGRAR